MTLRAWMSCVMVGRPPYLAIGVTLLLNSRWVDVVSPSSTSGTTSLHHSGGNDTLPLGTTSLFHNSDDSSALVQKQSPWVIRGTTSLCQMKGQPSCVAPETTPGRTMAWGLRFKVLHHTCCTNNPVPSATSVCQSLPASSTSSTSLPAPIRCWLGS